MRPLNTALLNKAVLCLGCCVLVFVLPGNIVAQVEQQQQVRQQPDPRAAVAAAHEQPGTSVASPSGQLASSELPDSPGAAWLKAQDASTQQNSSPQPVAPSSTQAGASQTGASQTTQSTAAQDKTQKPQRPVGTAAAEAPKVNGVTAAQPAGVAIAPAKQRRVRTIVLKVGALVGAGAAVGTVIALTAATPSKPPGAH